MWSVVRGVSKGKGQDGRSGKMLRTGDCMLVFVRAKVNAFVTMYERVSRVNVPRDRRMKVSVNRILTSHGSRESQPLLPFLKWKPLWKR